MATLLIPGYISSDHEVVPIEYIIQHVSKMKYLTNKVIVLKSSTGSGKSTILPVYLSRHFGAKKILSIQPRVFNTLSISKYISNEFKLTMGKNIGYYTGSFYRMPEEGILFMTSGSFVQYFPNESDDSICSEYAAIIIDEAHEIDNMGNILYLYVKEFMKRCSSRQDCPILIITSATFDHEHFMRYYDTNVYIEVGGVSHPITEYYLKYSTDDYIETAVTTAAAIHGGDPLDMFECKNIKTGLSEGVTDLYLLSINKSDSKDKKIKTTDKSSKNMDILVFLPGFREIEAFTERWNKLGISDVVLLPLNSDIVTSHGKIYEDIMSPAKSLGVRRKIILSTNVGETGITYINLGYVIDSGYYKTQDYIYDYNIYYNTNKSISTLSAYQRMGRVGRTGAGCYYALYTREIRNKLSFTSNNHIYRDDNTISYLQLLGAKSEMNIGATNIKLLYTPAIHADWRATEKLYILGFINSKSQLTRLGKLANKIGIFSIEALKIVLAGYVWHAPILDLITIAYAVQNALPSTDTLYSKEVQCDFMPAVEDLYKNGKHGIFADHYSVFMDLRDSVIENLAVAGLNPYENHKSSYPNEDSRYISRIKQCIYEGLKLNSANWNGSKYVTTTGIELPDRFPCHVNNFVYSALQINSKQTYHIRGKSVLDGYINFTPDFF